MSEKNKDLDAPDLKSLLAEASPRSESVTVPMKQGLAERIRAAEAELLAVPDDAKSRRMGSKSPLKAKAEAVEALRVEMSESALTFHFEALSESEREQIRKDMQGRDDGDEVNLRATAAMCRRVVHESSGTEYGDGWSWTDFRDLRDRLGAHTYDLTIDAASSRASGGDWSVPFSSAASLILGTQT